MFAASGLILALMSIYSLTNREVRTMGS